MNKFSINNEKSKVDKVKHSIHWYGFPKLETKPESYHNSLIRILCAIDYDYTYPLLVYPMDTRLPDLEKITHTDTEYLNTVGITIYLNEPLNVYNSDGEMRAIELDCILAYIKHNNLTKVTVHTCDYRCNDLLPYYTQHMVLLTDDVFIKTIFPHKATLSQDRFTKRFINLNWRYTNHRHLTAAFLSQMDSHYTWKYVVDDSVLSAYDWINIEELDTEFNNKVSTGLEQLNELAPVNLDINVSAEVINDIHSIHNTKRVIKEHLSTLDGTGQTIEHFYADIFCDVVTETKYNQQTGNISEKTFRPISFLKPFILVAPPLCLEYLSDLGFKTFSDYWDESYDLELDSHRRLIKIFKVIEGLNETPIHELRQMYKDMQPVLDHNYNLLHSKFPRKTMAQRIATVNDRLRKELWIRIINPIDLL